MLQTPETLAEKQFYAEAASREIPKFHKASFALAPSLLKSALFNAASKGDRVNYTSYTPIPVHSNTLKLSYSGTELRQDDLRVLLCLIKIRSGFIATEKIEFKLRAFAVNTLKWADSSTSVTKLKQCLVRLHSARVMIEDANQFESYYSFISDLDMDATSATVWLSDRVADLFNNTTLTYFNSDERLQAKDGLRSWLLTFIKADACHAPFKVSKLLEFSGCGYSASEFNRALKETLVYLLSIGVIEDFDVKGGVLSIRK